MSRLSKAAILGFLTGIVGLGVSLSPLGLDLEENIGLDLLFSLRGTRQPPPDVIIVSIDQKSATNLNVAQDPRKWPRSFHAQLTEKLVPPIPSHAQSALIETIHLLTSIMGYKK
jgi:adenylate cyclase